LHSKGATRFGGWNVEGVKRFNDLKNQHFKCYLSMTNACKEDPHWCSATGLPMGVGDHHFAESVLERKCRYLQYRVALVVLQLSVVG